MSQGLEEDLVSDKIDQLKVPQKTHFFSAIYFLLVASVYLTITLNLVTGIVCRPLIGGREKTVRLEPGKKRKSR